MALPGQTIEEITEVHSHYMAIAQTREFFKLIGKIIPVAVPHQKPHILDLAGGIL